MSSDDRALALRVFISLLSNQEYKQDAIACEAGRQLVRHTQSTDQTVASLSCQVGGRSQCRPKRAFVADSKPARRAFQAITCLALTMVGRFHVIEAGSVEALTAVLGFCPKDSCQALAASSQG